MSGVINDPDNPYLWTPEEEETSPTSIVADIIGVDTFQVPTPPTPQGDAVYSSYDGYEDAAYGDGLVTPYETGYYTPVIPEIPSYESIYAQEVPDLSSTLTDIEGFLGWDWFSSDPAKQQAQFSNWLSEMQRASDRGDEGTIAALNHQLSQVQSILELAGQEGRLGGFEGFQAFNQGLARADVGWMQALDKFTREYSLNQQTADTYNQSMMAGQFAEDVTDFLGFPAQLAYVAGSPIPALGSFSTNPAEQSELMKAYRQELLPDSVREIALGRGYNDRVFENLYRKSLRGDAPLLDWMADSLGGVGTFTESDYYEMRQYREWLAAGGGKGYFTPFSERNFDATDFEMKLARGFGEVIGGGIKLFDWLDGDADWRMLGNAAEGVAKSTLVYPVAKAGWGVLQKLPYYDKVFNGGMYALDAPFRALATGAILSRYYLTGGERGEGNIRRAWGEEYEKFTEEHPIYFILASLVADPLNFTGALGFSGKVADVKRARELAKIRSTVGAEIALYEAGELALGIDPKIIQAYSFTIPYSRKSARKMEDTIARSAEIVLGDSAVPVELQQYLSTFIKEMTIKEIIESRWTAGTWTPDKMVAIRQGIAERLLHHARINLSAEQYNHLREVIGPDRIGRIESELEVVNAAMVGTGNQYRAFYTTAVTLATDPQNPDQQLAMLDDGAAISLTSGLHVYQDLQGNHHLIIGEIPDSLRYDMLSRDRALVVYNENPLGPRPLHVAPDSSPRHPLTGDPAPPALTERQPHMGPASPENPMSDSEIRAAQARIRPSEGAAGTSRFLPSNTRPTRGTRSGATSSPGAPRRPATPSAAPPTSVLDEVDFEGGTLVDAPPTPEPVAPGAPAPARPRGAPRKGTRARRSVTPEVDATIRNAPESPGEQLEELGDTGSAVPDVAAAPDTSVVTPKRRRRGRTQEPQPGEMLNPKTGEPTDDPAEVLAGSISQSIEETGRTVDWQQAQREAELPRSYSAHRAVIGFVGPSSSSRIDPSIDQMLTQWRAAAGMTDQKALGLDALLLVLQEIHGVDGLSKLLTTALAKVPPGQSVDLVTLVARLQGGRFLPWTTLVNLFRVGVPRSEIYRLARMGRESQGPALAAKLYEEYKARIQAGVDAARLSAEKTLLPPLTTYTLEEFYADFERTYERPLFHTGPDALHVPQVVGRDIPLLRGPEGESLGQALAPLASSGIKETKQQRVERLSRWMSAPRADLPGVQGMQAKLIQLERNGVGVAEALRALATEKRGNITALDLYNLTTQFGIAVIQQHQVQQLQRIVSEGHISPSTLRSFGLTKDTLEKATHDDFQALMLLADVKGRSTRAKQMLARYRKERSLLPEHDAVRAYLSSVIPAAEPVLEKAQREAQAAFDLAVEKNKELVARGEKALPLPRKKRLSFSGRGALWVDVRASLIKQGYFRSRAAAHAGVKPFYGLVERVVTEGVAAVHYRPEELKYWLQTQLPYIERAAPSYAATVREILNVPLYFTGGKTGNDLRVNHNFVNYMWNRLLYHEESGLVSRISDEMVLRGEQHQAAANEARVMFELLTDGLYRSHHDAEFKAATAARNATRFVFSERSRKAFDLQGITHRLNFLQHEWNALDTQVRRLRSLGETQRLSIDDATRLHAMTDQMGRIERGMKAIYGDERTATRLDQALLAWASDEMRRSAIVQSYGIASTDLMTPEAAFADLVQYIERVGSPDGTVDLWVRPPDGEAVRMADEDAKITARLMLSRDGLDTAGAARLSAFQRFQSTLPSVFSQTGARARLTSPEYLEMTKAAEAERGHQRAAETLIKWSQWRSEKVRATVIPIAESRSEARTFLENMYKHQRYDLEQMESFFGLSWNTFDDFEQDLHQFAHSTPDAVKGDRGRNPGPIYNQLRLLLDATGKGDVHPHQTREGQFLIQIARAATDQYNGHKRAPKWTASDIYYVAFPARRAGRTELAARIQQAASGNFRRTFYAKLTRATGTENLPILDTRSRNNFTAAHGAEPISTKEVVDQFWRMYVTAVENPGTSLHSALVKNTTAAIAEVQGIRRPMAVSKQTLTDNWERAFRQLFTFLADGVVADDDLALVTRSTAEVSSDIRRQVSLGVSMLRSQVELLPVGLKSPSAETMKPRWPTFTDFTDSASPYAHLRSLTTEEWQISEALKRIAGANPASHQGGKQLVTDQLTAKEEAIWKSVYEKGEETFDPFPVYDKDDFELPDIEDFDSTDDWEDAKAQIIQEYNEAYIQVARDNLEGMVEAVRSVIPEMESHLETPVELTRDPTAMGSQWLTRVEEIIGAGQRLGFVGKPAVGEGFDTWAHRVGFPKDQTGDELLETVFTALKDWLNGKPILGESQESAARRVIDWKMGDAETSNAVYSLLLPFGSMDDIRKIVDGARQTWALLRQVAGHTKERWLRYLADRRWRGALPNATRRLYDGMLAFFMRMRATQRATPELHGPFIAELRQIAQDFPVPDDVLDGLGADILNARELPFARVDDASRSHAALADELWAQMGITFPEDASFDAVAVPLPPAQPSLFESVFGVPGPSDQHLDSLVQERFPPRESFADEDAPIIWGSDDQRQLERQFFGPTDAADDWQVRTLSSMEHYIETQRLADGVPLTRGQYADILHGLKEGFPAEAPGGYAGYMDYLREHRRRYVATDEYLALGDRRSRANLDLSDTPPDVRAAQQQLDLPAAQPVPEDAELPAPRVVDAFVPASAEEEMHSGALLIGNLVASSAADDVAPRLQRIVHLDNLGPAMRGMQETTPQGVRLPTWNEGARLEAVDWRVAGPALDEVIRQNYDFTEILDAAKALRLGRGTLPLNPSQLSTVAQIMRVGDLIGLDLSRFMSDLMRTANPYESVREVARTLTYGTPEQVGRYLSYYQYSQTGTETMAAWRIHGPAIIQALDELKPADSVMDGLSGALPRFEDGREGIFTADQMEGNGRTKLGVARLMRREVAPTEIPYGQRANVDFFTTAMKERWGEVERTLKVNGAWPSEVRVSDIDRILFPSNERAPIDLELMFDRVAAYVSELEGKRLADIAGVSYEEFTDIPWDLRAMIGIKAALSHTWMTFWPGYHIQNIAGNFFAQFIGALRNDTVYTMLPRRDRWAINAMRPGNGWSPGHKDVVRGQLKARMDALDGEYTRISSGTTQRLEYRQQVAPGRAVQNVGTRIGGWIDTTRAGRYSGKVGDSFENHFRSTIYTQEARRRFGTLWHEALVSVAGKELSPEQLAALRTADGTQSLRDIMLEQGIARREAGSPSRTLTARDRALAAREDYELGPQMLPQMRAERAGDALSDRLLSAMRGAIRGAEFYGEKAVREAMRDYSYRSRLDIFLDRFLPIHFWQTHNTAFVAKTLLHSPALLAGVSAAAYKVWEESEGEPYNALKEVRAPGFIPLVGGDQVGLRLAQLVNPAIAGAAMIAQYSREDWNRYQDQGLMDRVAAMGHNGTANFWEAMGYDIGPVWDTLAWRLPNAAETADNAWFDGNLKTEYWAAAYNRYAQDFFEPRGYHDSLIPLGGLEAIPSNISRQVLAVNLLANRAIYGGNGMTELQASRMARTAYSMHKRGLLTADEYMQFRDNMELGNVQSPAVVKVASKLQSSRTWSLLESRTFRVPVSARSVGYEWGELNSDLNEYFQMVHAVGREEAAKEFVGIFPPEVRALMYMEAVSSPKLDGSVEAEYPNINLNDAGFLGIVGTYQGKDITPELIQEVMLQQQRYYAYIALEPEEQKAIGQPVEPHPLWKEAERIANGDRFASWEEVYDMRVLTNQVNAYFDLAGSMGYAAASDYYLGRRDEQGVRQGGANPALGTYFSANNTFAERIEAAIRQEEYNREKVYRDELSLYYEQAAASRAEDSSLLRPYRAKLEGLYDERDAALSALEKGESASGLPYNFVGAEQIVNYYGDKIAVAREELQEAAGKAGIDLEPKIPRSSYLEYDRDAERNHFIEANEANDAVNRYEMGVAQNEWIMRHLIDDAGLSLWVNGERNMRFWDGDEPDYDALEEAVLTYVSHDLASEQAAIRSVITQSQNLATRGLVTGEDIYNAVFEETVPGMRNWQEQRDSQIDAVLDMPEFGATYAEGVDNRTQKYLAIDELYRLYGEDYMNKRLGVGKQDSYGPTTVEQQMMITNSDGTTSQVTTTTETVSAKENERYGEAVDSLREIWTLLTPNQRANLRETMPTAFDGDYFRPAQLTTEQVNTLIDRYGSLLSFIATEERQGIQLDSTYHQAGGDAREQLNRQGIVDMALSDWNAGAGLSTEEQERMRDWNSFIQPNRELLNALQDDRQSRGITWRALLSEYPEGSREATFITDYLMMIEQTGIFDIRDKRKEWVRNHPQRDILVQESSLFADQVADPVPASEPTSTTAPTSGSGYSNNYSPGNKYSNNYSSGGGYSSSYSSNYSSGGKKDYSQFEQFFMSDIYAMDPVLSQGSGPDYSARREVIDEIISILARRFEPMLTSYGDNLGQAKQFLTQMVLRRILKRIGKNPTLENWQSVLAEYRKMFTDDDDVLVA